MNDRNAGEEMVSEMGIDPALDIDTDQRAELLRRWHEEDARAAEETDTDGSDEHDRDSPRRD